MKIQTVLLAFVAVMLIVFFYFACDAQRMIEEAGTRVGGFAGSQSVK